MIHGLIEYTEKIKSKRSLKCTTANKLYNIETKEYEQKDDR